VIGEDAGMAGVQVELAILPAGALRLAGLAIVFRRVTVDHRDQLAVRLKVRDPSAADPDEPQVTLLVESAALEELALRGIADIGEFLDRSNPLRQRRQPPRLDRPRIGRLGGRLSKSRAA